MKQRGPAILDGNSTTKTTSTVSSTVSRRWARIRRSRNRSLALNNSLHLALFGGGCAALVVSIWRALRLILIRYQWMKKRETSHVYGILQQIFEVFLD